MFKNIKKLEIIQNRIEANKLNPKNFKYWEINILRLLEELLDLKKLGYANKISLQLLKRLKKSITFEDIKIINKEIEEVLDYIDSKRDELYYKNRNRKRTLKKIILGALIGGSTLISGHQKVEEVKPAPQKPKIEIKYRNLIPEPEIEMQYAKKEHLSKKQLKEIKELADITYAEICEYASPKKYNKHVIITVSSTILNRVKQRPKEFGNTIHKVINKKNAYYGRQNKMYKQAKRLKFTSDENKQAYINTYKLVKKVYLGQIKRYPGFFFFTPREVKKLKNSKYFNFALLEYNYAVGPYYVYSYKS